MNSKAPLASLSAHLVSSKERFLAHGSSWMVSSQINRSPLQVLSLLQSTPNSSVSMYFVGYKKQKQKTNVNIKECLI